MIRCGETKCETKYSALEKALESRSAPGFTYCPWCGTFQQPGGGITERMRRDAYCAIRSSPTGEEWMDIRAIGHEKGVVKAQGFPWDSQAAKDYPIVRIVPILIQEMEEN